MIRAATLVLLLLLAGCAAPPAPPAAVTLVSGDASGCVVAPAPGASFACTLAASHALGDGRCEVEANLVNRTDRPLAVEIQASFEAGPGGPPAEVTPWRTVRLAPGATETVRFDASSPGPRTYVVRARRLGGNPEKAAA